MKSTEFIIEAEVKPYNSSVLDVDAAVAMLNAHCSQAISMIEHPLWRGMRNHSEEIVTIAPSTGRRESQNTSNHYTALMDNSPYFKGWPKRSKSLICSSLKKYADAFKRDGTLYAIFPYDDVKIAVCPKRDMWMTPVKMPGLGIEFNTNKSWQDLSDFTNFLRNLGFPESYEGMKSAVHSEAVAKGLDIIHNSLPAEETKIVPTVDDILPYVQKALSPQATGMKLMSIQEFSIAKPQDNECWVSGPIVAIREDMYEKFLDAVHKRQIK